MPSQISRGPSALPSRSAEESPLRLERSQCLRLDQAIYREWLETNGKGGYAASTALLCPTRRYHGLLVAPVAGTPAGTGSQDGASGQGPAAEAGSDRERYVFLSRFEEELRGPKRSFSLSNARYGDIYAPQGFQSIQSFDARPVPTWTYALGTALVRRSVMMVRGSHTVLLRYTLEGGPPEGLDLRIRPLLAFRRSHDLTDENVDLDPRVKRLPGGVLQFRPYAALPSLRLSAGRAKPSFQADPLWYRRLEYTAELRRGYDGHEDLFSPGILDLSLEPGGEVVVAATLEEAPVDPVALWRQESARRVEALRLANGGRSTENLGSALEQAAGQFPYTDPNGRMGIQAGLPWFGEGARETFIALPGLSLHRGQPDLSLAVLTGALPFLRRGLLPKVFGLTPETSQYTSADAGLWFARAVQLHQRATGHAGLVRARFRGVLTGMAQAYRSGTELGMAVDAEGLLRVGEAQQGTTWMDAQVNGAPATPRSGRPVELNALWYQLQRYLAELAEDDGDVGVAAAWRGRAERTAQAFRARFWSSSESYLADCVEDHPEGLGTDWTIRPNAVIAASFEYSPLSRAERADVVQRALAELLTPRGLRSLSPHDRRYQGCYGGDPNQRDAAYHQGSVWPWLLGPLTEAALRAFPANGPRVRRVAEVVHNMVEHLPEHGIGQVSEVFDGDPPHRPGGTPAQAWSVAELLRALALLEERGA